MLRDKPLTELLEAFSSDAPTPGGGSAAALTGALGTSLLLMVSKLLRTRTNTDEEREALAAARVPLEALRDRLSALIDEDSAAYETVVAAYKLPKATTEQQQARRQGIQEALLAAAATPAAIMECCDRALGQAAVVAAYGNRSAASDIGVAVELVRAASYGAHLNVSTNLDGVSHPDCAEAAAALREQAGGYARAVTTGAARVRDILSG